MSQHLIAEFALPITIDKFCNLFWYSNSWYNIFLSEYLNDLNISIGQWNNCNEDNSKVREVKSDHPSKVSFPGLPSHAESFKVQKLTIDSSGKSLTLIETNKFKGIPMSDYFRVDTVWNVDEMNSSQLSETTIRIRIYCEVVFNQSTWLKGTIESNTKSELLSVFNLWKDVALKTIQEDNMAQLNLSNNQLVIDEQIDRIHTSQSLTDVRFPPLFVLDDSEVNGSNNLFSDTELQFYDCEEGSQSLSSSSHSNPSIKYDDGDLDEEYSALLKDVKQKQENMRGSYKLHHHPFDKYLLTKRDIAVNQDIYQYEEEDNDSENSSEEDEENHSENDILQINSNLRRTLKNKESGDSYSDKSKTKSKKSKKKYSLSPPIYRPLLTPAQILQMYEKNNVGNLTSPTPINQEVQNSRPEARYLVGAIAEVLFVLVESIFWRFHRIWVYDLRELYTVDPIEVFQRILFCFIPGSHSALLTAPDLYGPTMAVFILPQILLLSMDSAHHGCARSSLLRDAIGVSLCLWGGLSLFYRLFAFLVAPSIRIRHCLCLTGYSFYSWIVALLVSYGLRVYYPYLHFPPKIGLVLFSVPCAIAQGYVFWEYTPLSITPRNLPASWRRLTDSHRHLVERILWAIPKLVVLILVAVTHYQTLWYLARVFLPSRRHYCRFSALLNPANYADIITQKELREFTMKMLKKGIKF